MILTEFTSMVTTIFTNIELTMRRLKEIKDPNHTFTAQSYIKILEDIRDHISLLNKFSPLEYTNFYTQEEKERIFSLLKLADNYITSTQTSFFPKDTYVQINILTNDLIQYSRISKLLESISNQNKNSNNIKNEISIGISTISELKQEIEINSDQIRGLAYKNTESNEKIMNLIAELQTEREKSRLLGSEIDQILKQSKVTLSDINSINDILQSADIKLNDIIKKSVSTQNETSAFLSEKESEINTLINQKIEIENLNNIINAEIENAKELNIKAKSALNLSGTYRLSRHFKEAYRIANKNKMLWAITSIISALFCIAFIIYMLIKMNEISSYSSNEQGSSLLLLFIARFSMIPILIGFFVFSAMQYIKQNNISEDYAHKKLLSETLVSFKQEINREDTDRTSVFMDNILKSVLSSPLNSIDKKSYKMEVEKMNELIDATSRINKEIIERVIPSKEQK